MNQFKEIRKDVQDIILAAAREHPRPMHVRVSERSANGRENVILSADKKEKHLISPEEVASLTEWLASNPLFGPDRDYRVSLFTEDANGKVRASPIQTFVVERSISASSALAQASAQQAAHADAREDVARFHAANSLNNATTVIQKAAPNLIKAVEMSESPDPSQQAAGATLMNESAKMIADALAGFGQSAIGLQSALNAPRMAGGFAGTTPPMGAPMPTPIPSAIHAQQIGAPQVMHVPGYGPMAMVGGQLVAINAQPQKTKESETTKLLRELIARQNQPLVPVQDNSARDEMRALREQMARDRQTAAEVAAAAEKRALAAEHLAALSRAEAKADADKIRHENEIARLKSDTDARIRELDAKMNAPKGESDQLRFMAMMQTERQESARAMAQLQKDANDREERRATEQRQRDMDYQKRVDDANLARLEMLQEAANTDPNEAMVKTNAAMGQILSASMAMVTNASRTALQIGSPPKGKEPNPLIEGIREAVGIISNAIPAAFQNAQPQAQQEQQQPPAPQLPAPQFHQEQPQQQVEQRQPPPVSLDNARVKKAGQLVNDAQRAAMQSDMTTAFRKLNEAYSADPSLMAPFGNDDLRFMRAAYASLQNHIPPSVTQMEIGTAAVAVLGMGAIGQLQRFQAEVEAQTKPPESTESAPTTEHEAPPPAADEEN